MKCRHCAALLQHEVVDLGYAPPSNAYLNKAQLSQPEKYYPLKVLVCDQCWLVQTEDYTQADELFNADYAYFSSTSPSWLAHAKKYCDQMTEELKLNSSSLVIELASNDGYLLKNFVAAKIPCLGIEPTNSTAQAARQIGVPVIEEFFGQELATRLLGEGQQADLILGNNVYAHVPDINDFTRGMKLLLKPAGTITLEFPHLLNLLEHKQFDTIYHEHFSYLSLLAVQKIFKSCGLRVWHVEQLPTHGGSLRVYGCHDVADRQLSQALIELQAIEKASGLDRLPVYQKLQEQAFQIKMQILKFLIKAKEDGKSVVAYGAAAKGNTLLNYCGVQADLIDYVCDAASAKQNKFLPGSHIPILDPKEIKVTRPDYIVILPWNLKTEVKAQLSFVREWNARFITFIPELEVTD